MSQKVRLLSWAAAGIGFLAVATAGLYYANDWWQSGIMTVSILAWLGGLLATIYSPSDRRPFVIGAIVASLLYILFALGPWFRGNVGPWLVTSQALAHVETKWLGRQPPQPFQAFQPTWTSYPVVTGSGSYNTSSVVMSSTGFAPVVIPSGSASSRMIEIGHWLCAWIAAAIGGLAAAWMSRQHSAKGLTSDQCSQPITPTNQLYATAFRGW